MPEKQKKQESSKLIPSLAIGGGAMAAPFMGLIGQKPITKDPYYNKDIATSTNNQKMFIQE